MNKLAYLECPTGIAGDMCLGALVDLGVPLAYLSEQLKGLGIDSEYRLWAEKVDRNGQQGTKVHVDLISEYHHPPARHLPEIENLIIKAKLPPKAEQWSLAVFRQLAVAEGAVHGIAPEQVHFHEVGATDAIIDIVGTCLGLDWLGINQLYCSPLPTGGGTVKAAHGRLPVPVPAVLKLWELRSVPLYSNSIEQELVTPTGAAIAVTLADDFCSPPAMILKKIGLGAGSKDLVIPNLLRLWLGESNSEENNWQNEIISVLETQIDDLSPQGIGYVLERLFQVGALDVFTQAIGMKKSRPGILLTVICPPEKMAICQQIIFTETTTLGIRYYQQNRSILRREIQEIDTQYGKIRVKIAYQGTGANKQIIKVQPEYEDCANLARKLNQPWRVIHQLVLDTWQKKYDQLGIYQL
jgi:uncharacterized protein (TIGR00299 family) protein